MWYSCTSAQDEAYIGGQFFGARRTAQRTVAPKELSHHLLVPRMMGKLCLFPGSPWCSMGLPGSRIMTILPAAQVECTAVTFARAIGRLVPRGLQRRDAGRPACRFPFKVAAAQSPSRRSTRPRDSAAPDYQARRAVLGDHTLRRTRVSPKSHSGQTDRRPARQHRSGIRDLPRRNTNKFKGFPCALRSCVIKLLKNCNETATFAPEADCLTRDRRDRRRGRAPPH